jgi:TolB-like protein
MMKKLFTLAMTMLMAMGLSAQDEKTVVCVGQFQNNSNKSSIISKNLRNEIMDGIIEKDRLTVVDITTLGDLPKEKNELVKMLNEKGIEFIIEGTLNSVDVKKDDKYYKSEINYTLTIIDTSTGITKNTETFKDTWNIGSTNDEAILKAIEYAKGRMSKYIDNNFKVEAVIKALDQVDAKKGVKTCYISTGSAAGIGKGQIFEVFIVAEVAGEKIQKKIAEVKAKEVMSPTLTLCEVKNGGMEIKTNFESKIPMTVVSRAQKGLFNNLLK